MSQIRCIYHGAAPPFPPTDQHPDAVRYRIEIADKDYFVDAVGGEPPIEHVEAALQSPVPEAAKMLDQHLAAAISEFSPSRGSKPVMSGMQRLANLTESVVKLIDARADEAADRIAAAQVRAEAAIKKFDEHAAGIERTAAEIEAALGQISNGPPSEGSGG